MNKIDAIYPLVKEALAELDQPDHKTSSILRKAIRIAKLRNDYENLFWLELEIIHFNDFNIKTHTNKFWLYLTESKYQEVINKQLTQYINERYVNNKLLSDKINGNSILEIEDFLRDFEKIEKKHDYYIYIYPLLRHSRSLLNIIEQRIFNLLIQTEKQLFNNQLYSDLFERTQLYVDARLADICPKALEQFKIAYQSLNNNHQESNSHALTSCRRILESVADALYPASDPPVTVKGSDKKERKLTQDKYINRLWQFVDEKVKGHTAGEVLLSEINDLGNRINKVYDLSCKGVHSDISNDEFD